MSAPTADGPTTIKRPDAPSPTGPRRDDRLRLQVHDTADTGPQRNVSAIVLGVLLFAACLALGYGAWLMAQEQQRAETVRRNRLATRQAFEAQSARARTRIAALERSNLEQAEQVQSTSVELLEVRAALAAAQARLEGLEAERAELDVQMAEYRKVTQQFRSMIDSGKLSVTFRRGRMIVELPAAVLFASGSAELSAPGAAALKEVASVLSNVPGKRFIVAGHTDNVPISKAATGHTSNWALSAARAVIVTEALLAAGLPPAQLSAAGYGEFDPIASNLDPAGRQKNRRIEVVLEPELKAFPSALDEKVARQEGIATPNARAASAPAATP